MIINKLNWQINNFTQNYNRSNFKKIILKEEYPTVDFYIISEQNYGNYNDTWEGLTWKNVYPFLKKNGMMLH